MVSVTLRDAMKVGLIFKLILLVSIIPIGSTVQAQLSAITANTIQGSAPNIISAEGRTPDDINDILHFTIPNPQQTGKFITYFGDSSFEDVTFPETLTFNDFNIQDWDNSLLIDYDGDQPHPTEMITYTNLTATWVDKLGNTPNLADNLDSCFAPYKLTVKAENLTVKTEYGNPNHNTVGTLTKTFSINVDEPKICFIQPSYLGRASWANSDGTGRPLITIGGDGNKSASGTNFGGGYSDDFLPTIGFKAHIDSDKFPTTAFKGAAFTLITAQTTSPINFDITSAPSFTTLTANGTFTFNTQPPSLPLQSI